VQRVLAALKLTGMAAALSFIMTLVLAGCPVEPDPESGGGGDFVAVTGISGVPVQAVVNQELPLTGIVTPDNAANKTIAWTVKTPGNTGATISNGKLTATAAGTVTVTAVIANGKSRNEAFTKDFTIKVYAAGQAPRLPKYP
jgi:endo-1,4-beta-xylanase